MATYVYETIPGPDGTPSQRFEVVQSMKDAALTRHPDTGAPVRRVISGGFGVMSKPQASSFSAASAAPAGCSPGCACHRPPRLPAP